jgi:hypothetical protein
MTALSRNNQEGTIIVYTLKFFAIVVTGLRLLQIIKRPGGKNDVRRSSPLGLTEVFHPAFSRKPASAGR